MTQPELDLVSAQRNRRPTQASKILAYLRQGHRLTPLAALDLFGCYRLAARIHELRADGHTIVEQTIKTPSGKRIAEYSL